MPQPFLDCLPSECSPREDRGPLSGPLASLQLSTVLRNAPPATLLLAVSPTPTLLTQLPGSPTSYGSPFHESEGSLPGRPGSPTEGPPLPPASPASKLSSLHESVRTDPSCLKPSGRYSPGLMPLSRPNRPNLGSSNPLESLRTQARTLSRRIRSATPGTTRPLDSRVKPPQNIDALGQLRRQSPVLFRTGPHRRSAATPSPLTFQLTVSRQPWPSELLSTWEVDSSPKRPVDLVWGFLPPRATSKLRSPADPGSWFHREHRYVSPRTQRTLRVVL